MKSLSLQAINESSSYEVSVVYDGYLKAGSPPMSAELNTLSLRLR